MTSIFHRFIKKFCASNSGTTVALFALFVPVAVGVLALVADLGHADQVQRALQTSADAAVLAGAQDIGSVTTDPLVTASAYGASGNNTVAGANNLQSSSGLSCLHNVTFGVCSGTPASAASGCNASGAAGCNAIWMQISADVDTVFAKFFGLQSIHVVVNSKAVGSHVPYDIVVIMDATGSMLIPDLPCATSPNAKRQDCAKNALKLLMRNMNPAYDHIAILTFPGLATPYDAQLDRSCQAVKTVTAVKYYVNPIVYQLVPAVSEDGFVADYWQSSRDNTLNESSDAVKVAGYPGCSGLIVPNSQPKPERSTYIAAVISKAHDILKTYGRPNAQKAIVLLSDGDSHTSGAPSPSTQCYDAVQNAATAKNDKVDIYVAGFGVDVGGCDMDSVKTTACDTLKNIASTPVDDHFFYDRASAARCGAGTAADDLNGVFLQIARRILRTSLVPFDAS